MKQTFRVILALLSIAFSANVSFSQIPGKIYQPGDTIILDGMSCLVYKVDDTGMHGTAMSPYARSVKKLEKLKKQTIKRFEREIKNGKATKEDMEIWLTHFNSSAQIPFLWVEKAKKGIIFRVDDWSTLIPNGWRIPSTKDAEEFATFYCGGIGKDNGIKFTFLSKTYKLTIDPLARENLLEVANNGMIISDSNMPKDVKFLQRWYQKLSGKHWFEIKEKFIGKEKTVAVKDF